MDAFSYLSVLLSIILGLAITEVLSRIGRLLQARAEVRPYWPALVWAAVLLVMYVQTWWAMFGLRSVPAWTFGAFAIVLLQITLQYLLSALSLGGLDLRESYYAHSRWFFSILATAAVVSLLKDVVLTGALPNRSNTAFHAAFIAIAVVSAATRAEWFHKLQAVATALVFGLYVALLFTRLPS
jgi:hypothetical protein